MDKLAGYLRSANSFIRTKLSYTESALILRELYCDTFLPDLDMAGDTALGIVARRIDKEPVVDDTISNMLKEYVQLEVKEHLGLTFDEYLDTNIILRIQYTKFLEELIAEKNKAFDELKETQNSINGVGDE